MTPEVFAVVLTAALLHAGWNAIVKTSGDPLLAQWIVIVAGSVLCLPFVALVPLPRPESLPWLLCGVAIHNVYYLALAESYRVGDLSQVYPLARGSAPLLVASGSILWVGEALTPESLAGVGVVAIGVASLTSTRGANGSRPVLLGLLVGLLIGGYSLVDGVGVRRAGSPFSFIVWLEVLCGIPITCVALLRRWGRVRGFLRTGLAPAALGGVVSTLAYAGVLWAYARAPLAEVSALRETSVVFGAAIGALWLKESFGLRRLIAAAIVALGVALLQLG